MGRDPLQAIPEERRAAAQRALSDVFGGVGGLVLTPMTGGSSGALLFRAQDAGRQVVLRMEGPEKPLFKPNPHRWLALRRAAEAGVTPPLWNLDEEAGVSVSSFVAAQPFSAHPGGAAGLASELGRLTSELQALEPLPELVDYRELVAGMLRKIASLNVFAAGALDPHLEALAQLSGRLDWDPERFVSAHNDPNPGNVLFDGERLWLIDWESAYGNAPLVDLAIMTDGMAPTPELEDALLTGWLGRRPDSALKARLEGVRRLTRLYYACFLVDAGAEAAGPDTTPAPPPAGQVRDAIANGRLAKGSAAASLVLGQAYLAAFRTGATPPELRAALAPLT